MRTTQGENIYIQMKQMRNLLCNIQKQISSGFSWTVCLPISTYMNK